MKNKGMSFNNGILDEFYSGKTFIVTDPKGERGIGNVGAGKTFMTTIPKNRIVFGDLGAGASSRVFTVAEFDIKKTPRYALVKIEKDYVYVYDYYGNKEAHERTIKKYLSEGWEYADTILQKQVSIEQHEKDIMSMLITIKAIISNINSSYSDLFETLFLAVECRNFQAAIEVYISVMLDMYRANLIEKRWFYFDTKANEISILCSLLKLTFRQLQDFLASEV